MKQVKQYAMSIGYFLGGMLILSLILSILNYFDIFSVKICYIISWIFMLFFQFFTGIFYGRKAEKNGYLEGLKWSGIFLLLLVFINVVFFQSGFPLARIIYYLILAITTVIGSMIGINKKMKH